MASHCPSLLCEGCTRPHTHTWGTQPVHIISASRHHMFCAIITNARHASSQLMQSYCQALQLSTHCTSHPCHDLINQCQVIGHTSVVWYVWSPESQKLSESHVCTHYISNTHAITHECLPYHHTLATTVHHTHHH